MPRYVVLYRFTEQGAKSIRDTVERARQTREENERRGFKVQALLWTQGPYDLVAIVEAPSEEAMMGGMVNVVSAGNVTSTTMRAFDEQEMENILKQA
ncbi:MAG: GYD domain-containing protein [Dehalococcoidia bacterium]